MAQYYRELDCPNYASINQQILEFIIKKEILSRNDFWNHVDVIEFVRATPLLVQYLKSFDLVLRDVAVTVGKSPRCCPLHTDTPPAKIKLNWPVMNTQGTFTRWFRAITDPPATTVNTLGGTAYTNYAELEEIERVELLRPCLIDATVPHDVLIGDTAVLPRVGLQCMFFKEPESINE